MSCDDRSLVKNSLYKGEISVRLGTPSVSSQPSPMKYSINSSKFSIGLTLAAEDDAPSPARSARSAKCTPKSSHARLAPALSRTTTLPETLLPKGRMSSVNPFFRPFCTASSSTSLAAHMATVGENARTINDLESSYPSVELPSGLFREDFPNLETEADNLPFGEFDLEMTLDRVLVREPNVGGLERRIGRLVVDVSGDSSVADGVGVGFLMSRMGTEERFPDF